MARRLTILTQWYPPEQAPFGRMMHELAVDLTRRGWQVTVITGFPNHPGGTVFGGYRKRWLFEDRDSGALVQRVWLWTSENRSLLSRVATFVTFTLTSFWRFLRGPRPDVLFAVLQPLSVGGTLPLAAASRRCALVFNLQDLHPDTQIRLGMVRNRALIGLLRAIEAFAYRHCDRLTVICDAFARHATSRGASPDRVRVISNWVDTDRICPSAEGLEIRREAGLEEDHVVALWAGTLGHVSGAEVVIDAAALLREHPRLRFLIVGEGPRREQLVARVRELALENVAFLPFQPETRLNAVQNAGDLSIVTLAHAFAESSVPSKVLAYMAAGRGVIAAVRADSPTARLIKDARCGVVVPPEDASGLAQALVATASDASRMREFGERARYWALHYLSRETAVEEYDRLFSQLVRR